MLIIDRTWGILPLSSMYPLELICHFKHIYCFLTSCLFWLQLKTVQKCLLKSGIFWRESFVSHSKRGPRKNSSPLLPFTGIVKDLSPQTLAVATIKLHASVSPLLSFGLFFNLLFFEFCLSLSSRPPLMQNWMKVKGKALFAKMPLNAQRSSRTGRCPLLRGQRQLSRSWSGRPQTRETV